MVRMSGIIFPAVSCHLPWAELTYFPLWNCTWSSLSCQYIRPALTTTLCQIVCDPALVLGSFMSWIKFCTVSEHVLFCLQSTPRIITHLLPAAVHSLDRWSTRKYLCHVSLCTDSSFILTCLPLGQLPWISGIGSYHIFTLTRTDYIFPFPPWSRLQLKTSKQLKETHRSFCQ